MCDDADADPPRAGDRANEDRSGNTLPGTVIDSGICSAAGFDFFLNSHAGLQGHNKASHYQVGNKGGGWGQLHGPERNQGVSVTPRGGGAVSCAATGGSWPRV